jgi:molybdopterin-containing oxidoreductase family iron-sulfur binding subunit
VTEKPRIDIGQVRGKLEELRGREYWRSLEEIARTEDFQEHLHREFRVPIESGIDRRELMTLMGASMALAGLTGCTRQPEEKILPYVRTPEDLAAGQPLFYATAHLHGGYARGILAETHNGRPTKIEGNELHPGSLGATDVFAQASILSLYDPDRSQTLTRLAEIRPWSALLVDVKLALEKERPRKGAGLRVLTPTVTSPTLAAQLSDFLAAFPAAKWISWEPCGRENSAQGARLAFGAPMETRFAFEKADVVLSLDADFLGSGPAQPRYVRDFSMRRRDPAAFSRLYVVEPTPSLTGARADHRRPMRPAEIAAFARTVAGAVGPARSPVQTRTAGENDPFTSAVVSDLANHAGKSLVVAGDALPPEVHAFAHLANEILGNVGQTVFTCDPVAAGALSGTPALLELTRDMAAGDVAMLLVLGGNPVFSAPADLKFAESLEKVPLRIRLGLYDDETSAHCHWHIPAAHPFEAWSDARGFDGTATILQPLIAPLYGGKSIHEVLAALSEQPERTGHDIVKDFWRKQVAAADFERFWRRALHDGVVAGTAFEPKTVKVNAGAVGAGLAPARGRPQGPPLLTAQEPSAPSLVALFRPDPTIHDGEQGNNGWLQELPKPLTKLTWDNAALIAASTAERLKLANEDVVTLTLDGRQIEAPVLVLPGQAEDCVTLHLGYGRSRGGRLADGAGFDAYRLRGSAAPWAAEGLQIAPTGRTRELAYTSHHHSMETPTGKRDIVRAATAAEYGKDPEVFAKMGEEPPGPEMTMYPKLPTGHYAWGLSIDLSTCVGCNACVVACQAENNIPVVGRVEVRRGRIMQWIRVDNYYEGGLDNPTTTHQPVPCMHCENAPCEVVCPVAATVHSAEGLNEMVYNRCVGTRYCSNNCPYKVRRFNFFLYADFATESLKLQRNPDVSVRSRGVMEKCSYCVQRINRARLEAEKENRPIKDGEIVTACQQACPAQAIVFGNINDPESRVARAKAEKRNYGLLAQLGTRPRTTYLASLSNPNPALPKAGPKAGDKA